MLRASRRPSAGRANRGREPSRRNEDRGQSGRRVGGAVIVVCAVVATLVALDYWSNAGNVYRGVEVAGVPLGGETPEGARRTLEEHASGMEDGIRLTGPGGGFVLNREEIGFRLDAAASAEKAYGVGRRGGIATRLGERLRAAFGTVGITPE
ncbi:MAG: hypothetical protein M3R38_21485, partial [Actinomycetota bacterium]|nr:hypothetical protein [Actinomycetota bacterium]